MKKYTIGLLATLFLLLTSCTLEKEDYTEIGTDIFPKTEQDAQLAVNALYSVFTSDWDSVYGSGNKGYQIFTEMSTDVLWCNWGWEWDQMHFQQWYATIGGGMSSCVGGAFSKYNHFSRIRNVVRRIEAMDIDQEVKNKYIAEAQALAGWLGVYMYDLFGPVPIASDEILDKPTEFIYIPRLTEEEYYEFMHRNLDFAIEYLPEKAARGRMTKGAARMLLLKYEMMTGHFVEAEKIARDLLDMENSVYTLQDDYTRIFKKEGIGNNEVILSVPCNNPESPNYLLAHIIPPNYKHPVPSATVYGAYVIPWAFYDTFEEGDIRQTCIETSYVAKDETIVEGRKPGNLEKGALPMKYGFDPDQTGPMASLDIVVYRFSDVLLSLAECIARNSDVTPEAVSLVNRVRTRAGLPGLAAEKSSSKEAFLEALLSERAHEFYFEGLRRQDLIRFGKYVEYANDRINKINAKEPNRAYYNVDESHNRFWIPIWRIDESKGAIKQNPGYEG